MSEWDEPLDNSVLDKLEKAEEKYRRDTIAKIKRGLKQAKQGKLIPHEVVMKRIKKRIKKAQNKRVKQFNKQKRS